MLLKPSDPIVPPPCMHLLQSFEAYLQQQPVVAKKLRLELVKHTQVYAV